MNVWRNCAAPQIGTFAIGPHQGDDLASVGTTWGLDFVPCEGRWYPRYVSLALRSIEPHGPARYDPRVPQGAFELAHPPSLFGILLVIPFWLVASFLVSDYAKNKGLNPNPYFYASIFFSRAVGFIAAAAAQPKPESKP